MADSGEYQLPEGLGKSELEDHLEDGFDRIARKASEAPTLQIPLSQVLDGIRSHVVVSDTEPEPPPGDEDDNEDFEGGPGE